MHTLYHPLTSHPFTCNFAYMEIPSCGALKPYIRCFWGSACPVVDQKDNHMSIVTPDTCMDIIFFVDYTLNTWSASFCGINDCTLKSHAAGSGHLTSTFAIRFYPWAVSLFTGDTLKDTRNAFLPADTLFAPIVKAIVPHLFDGLSIHQLAWHAEKALMECIRPTIQHPRLHNAMHRMFVQHGDIRIHDLASAQQMSTRQLERLFLRHVGMNPKQFATLVRYQQVLREALFDPAFDVQDAVLKYGYTDQSHLLHEFKKFHTMTPRDARLFALSQR